MFIPRRLCVQRTKSRIWAAAPLVFCFFIISCKSRTFHTKTLTDPDTRQGQPLLVNVNAADVVFATSPENCEVTGPEQKKTCQVADIGFIEDDVPIKSDVTGVENEVTGMQKIWAVLNKDITLMMFTNPREFWSQHNASQLIQPKPNKTAAKPQESNPEGGNSEAGENEIDMAFSEDSPEATSVFDGAASILYEMKTVATIQSVPEYLVPSPTFVSEKSKLLRLQKRNNLLYKNWNTGGIQGPDSKNPSKISGIDQILRLGLEVDYEKNNSKPTAEDASNFLYVHNLFGLFHRTHKKPIEGINFKMKPIARGAKKLKAALFAWNDLEAPNNGLYLFLDPKSSSYLKEFLAKQSDKVAEESTGRQFLELAKKNMPSKYLETLNGESDNFRNKVYLHVPLTNLAEFSKGVFEDANFRRFLAVYSNARLVK